MKRCDSCSKRVWPWQDWSGIGSIGFRLRDADAMVWHTACVVRDHLEHHRKNGCTSVCAFLGCPEP